MNTFNKKLMQLCDMEQAEKRQDYFIGSPEQCDFCKCNLNTGHTFFVDGKVKAMFANPPGAWANMCSQCFDEKGVGIGWGSGQLYQKQDNGKWLQTEGFDPNDTQLEY